MSMWFINFVYICFAVAVKVLNNPQRRGYLKRVMYCIADLLGCMGGNEAGIRSGPAGNKAWQDAFASLNVSFVIFFVQYV